MAGNVRGRQRGLLNGQSIWPFATMEVDEVLTFRADVAKRAVVSARAHSRMTGKQFGVHRIDDDGAIKIVRWL